MEAKDFLARVMPWPGEQSPGWVNLEYSFKANAKGQKFWSGKPFRALDDFMSYAAWATMQSNIGDVYYCLSLQRDIGQAKNGKVKTKRSIPGALLLKAIWLDVDVKAPPKGYATFLEAATAVAKFCKSAQIPLPTATVKSGGGIHVYWISNKPMDVGTWRPYATGLRALAEKHGLRCDYGVTTDAARILRVPGTWNYKTEPPKPVELANLDPADLDFETALRMLPAAASGAPVVTATVKAAAPTFDTSAFPMKAHNPALTGKLSDGLAHGDIPLKALPIIKGCPLYREAILTGGKDHQQPIWNLLILGTTFMEAGDKIAHAISKGHPGYKPDETDTMFARKLRERQERGLGWPHCTSYQNEGCGLCKTCPNFGKINSPLKLGMPVAKIAPVFPVAAPNSPAALLDLPEHYILDNNGWINHHLEVIDPAGGPPVPQDTPLFYCKLSQPYASHDDATDYLHFVASTSLGNARGVTIESKYWGNPWGLCDRMTEQGMKLNVDAKAQITRFIMAWITKLHQARAATASSPFGWYRADGKIKGFIYGGKIMLDTGAEEPSVHTDPAISATYRPRGDVQPWIDAMELIKGRAGLEAIVASSFGAPLLAMTGQTGGLLYAWGRGGVNKTTAMDIAVAVWGSGQTKETLKATPKSLIKKMGALQNLPLYWDEIQDEPSQAKVFDLMFSNTEGVSYGKLNAAGVYQQKTDWQTMCIAASNYSFVEYVAQRQKQTTAGMDRVFEYEVPEVQFESKFKTHQGDMMRAELRLNQFGAVGLLYGKWLAMNHQRIKTEVQATLDELDDELKSTSRERFWKTSVGCIVMGARYANEVLGQDVLDEKAIRAFLIDAYLKNRERIVEEQTDGGTVQNTEGVIGHFLGNETGRTLTTAGMPGPGKPGTLHIYDGPRLEYFREALTVQRVIDPTGNVLRVSSRAFRDFLRANKYNSTPVIRVMKRMYGMKIVRGNLATGTPYQGVREDIMTMPVPENSPFELYMWAKVPGDVQPDRIKDLISEQQVAFTAAVSGVPVDNIGDNVVTEAVKADQAAVKAMVEESGNATA